MNPHLGYALSDGLAVAELTPFRGADTFDDARLADGILELSQPGIEGGGSEDRVHEARVYPCGYGQTSLDMNVRLATDNGANYFNSIAPGKENEALFVGSTSGNQFEGTLPASGDFKVRAYLMRSAARRDEIANSRLEMISD